MQRIAFGDITMKRTGREGGISLSFREKIELSRLLDRLNVSVIELPVIDQPKNDALLVKAVATCVKHSAVAVQVMPDEESITCTWASLKEARKPRLQLCAPMSAVQMEYFWHVKPKEMLTRVDSAIRRCKSLCDDVEFVAEDASRSEMSFLRSAIQTAISAGATTITLCDTAGQLMPDTVGTLLHDALDGLEGVEGVRIGMLCSDSLYMAVACAVSAVRAGATEIKVASESCGVTRLDEMAAVLQAQSGLLEADSEIRMSEIKRITSQIERLCRGGSGKGPEEGNLATDESFILSQHDNREVVLSAIEKLGYVLSEEDRGKVYEAFTRIAAHKEHVTAHELDSIVASVAMQVPSTYRLSNYVINCGNVISASAHMKLQKEDSLLEGICIGDGPIDASFKCIEQILGRHYELDDFQIQAVTEGREAMGETIVRLRYGGKVYSGRGISTDIVGAGIHAYLNAVNKIVYEEAEA